MADLRARFIEDYAGGFLNVSRQEISSTGEVLSQDGFVEDQTIFVEDGVGVKSGLKLGVSKAECVDPTSDLGIVNVRFADRTYTKLRDTKVFLTAIASSQAALSDAVTSSITNIENAIENLDISNLNIDRKIASIDENLSRYTMDTGERLKVLETQVIPSLLEAITELQAKVIVLEAEITPNS